MTNCMNHDRLFLVNNLVNYAVITDTKFVEPNEISSQRLRSNVIQIIGQPIGVR